MTYKEIVDKVKKEFGTADVSNYEDHLALQINITGEGSGAFYAEINNGKLSVEPYNYIDNNAELTASADDIISVFTGELSISDAADEGKLEITGDYAKALSIQPVIENNIKLAKKTAAKKTTASKKAAAKEEKAPAKTAEKKAAAKTTKTEAKAESKAASKAVKETAANATAAKASKATRTAKKG